MEQTITGQAQVLHVNTLTIAQASNNLKSPTAHREAETAKAHRG